MRRILAVLLTAAPFVAAAVAAGSVRHDLRMLWMAVAATAAVWLVLAVTATRWGPGIAAGVALVVASGAAAGVALLLGARAVVGVVAVAVVLAGCATAGAALGRRARPAPP